MKHIKPGRGPSFMGGIGAVFVGIFGVGWTIMASSMGAPAIFPLFGVGFVILAIVMAVYNFSNATGKNRFSAFDITSDAEEPDPLNERFGGQRSPAPEDDAEAAAFCPFCGERAEDTYRYCRKCGKELPRE